MNDTYKALRATIRERGTARVYVFVGGLVAWAIAALAAVVLTIPPIATVIPLLILAATFEAIFALHVGVERIGRFLFVAYDDAWERVATEFGAPAGAIRLDALFTWIFIAAAVVNLLPLLMTATVAQEFVGVGLVHLVFVGRVSTAGRAARRQRAIDQRRFEELARGVNGSTGA